MSPGPPPRTWRAPLAVAALLLGTACALLAARVAAGHRLGLELGGPPRLRLAPAAAAALERLAAADERVVATYWVSAAERMPPRLRHLERDVTAVLETLRRAAPERFDWRVVHPEAADEAERARLARYLARVGVTPFRARRVERDAWVESTVLSTLELGAGPRPTARIDELGPGHLASLQALVAQHVELLLAPRRPVVALSAPAGFADLRARLAAAADVRDWSFERERALPADADLLVWIEPDAVEPAHLAALEAFRRAGGSAVVAASDLAAEVTALDPAPRVALARAGLAAAPLLAAYGAVPARDLVLDPAGGGTLGRAGGEPVPAPFVLRAIAPDQDFRGLRGQPNGTLVFGLATPLALDAARLAERGLVGRALATTSARATRRPLPDGPVDPARLAGAPTGKETLLALIEPADPDDPWSGRLVLAASAAPFRDELLDAEGLAHGALVDVLLASLASADRLALRAAAGAGPPRVPPLGASARLAARGAVVLGPAAALALLALLVRRRRGGSRRRGAPAGGPPLRPLAARAAAGTLVVVLAAALLRAAGPLALDATAGDVHGLPAATAEVLADAGLAGGDGSRTGPTRRARLELCFSPDAELPPAWRPLVRETLAAARELAAHAPGVELAVERRSAGERDGADGAGGDAAPEPVLVTTEEDGARVTRRVLAGGVARGPERPDGAPRSVPLRFADAASFERAELLLAAGLWRAATGRDVVCALASEPPRLSPAEALLDFQQQGLFAPGEGDAVRRARALLAGAGLDVRWVDPAAPELPEPCDLVVWLAPRRDARPMLVALADHLARGGAALVAAQTHEVLARGVGEGGRELAFWPRPQFCDLDRLYLPELGVRLEPDLVLDAVHATAPLVVRLERDGAVVEEPRPVIAPFLVRAAPRADAGAVAAGVGALVLPSPAAIALDRERLAARGLAARVLVAASERAWTFAWEGGDLPPSVLRGPWAPAAAAGGGPAPGSDPGSDDDGAPRGTPRPGAPLAVLVEGRFPRCVARAEGGVELVPVDDDGAPDGRLLLVGCAAAFRDEHLVGPGENDALLVSAAWTLAAGAPFGRLAGRRRAPPDLGWVEPERRVRLRALVVLGPALGLALLGALVGLARRAAARRAARLVRACTGAGRAEDGGPGAGAGRVEGAT